MTGRPAKAASNGVHQYFNPSISMHPSLQRLACPRLLAGASDSSEAKQRDARVLCKPKP